MGRSHNDFHLQKSGRVLLILRRKLSQRLPPRAVVRTFQLWLFGRQMSQQLLLNQHRPQLASLHLSRSLIGQTNQILLTGNRQPQITFDLPEREFLSNLVEHRVQKVPILILGQWDEGIVLGGLLRQRDDRLSGR